MSEAEDSPGRKRSPETRRRFWARPLFRHATRFVVLSGLLLLGAFALVLFAPISGGWVDPQLKSRWREATGIDVDYAGAELTLATGMVRVAAPRLIDPDSGDTLLQVESLEIRLDLISVARALVNRENRIQIRRIGLQGPLDLHLHERDGKFSLSPRLQRLRELVEARMKEAPDEDGFQADVEAIVLTGADLYLDRIGVEPLVHLAAIRETSLLTEFERGRKLPSHINLVGKLVGEGGSAGLTVQLEPDDEEEELRLKLRVNPLDSRKNLLSRLPVEFQTGPILAEGMLRRQAAGEWVLHAETSTPDVTLVGEGVHGVDHRIEQLVIGSSIHWRNEDKKLDLLSLNIAFKDGTAEAFGELQLQEPYAYTLELNDLELRGQAVALTERTFFGENRITTPDRGRLKARGEIGGKATRLKPESVLGEFALEDLTLSLPNLPEPVQSVALQAQITDTEVQVTEATALVQGLPLSVRGSMEGHPIEGRIDAARFDWRVSGELRGLNGLLAEQSRTADWKIGISGDVSGGGTIEVKNLELEHWGQMLEKADIGGRLVFNNAEVRTRHLRPPVKQVSGTLDFQKSKATLTELAGRIEDVDFELTGGLEGKDAFWREATLDAELDVRFGLGDIRRIFEWVNRTPPDLPSSSGDIHLTGRLRTPIDDPGLAVISGAVTGTDLRIQPEGPHLGGLIQLPDVEATLADHRLTLNRAVGKWGGVDVEVDGAFSTTGGRLDAKFVGDLVDFPELIPRQASRFDHLGGRVNLQTQVIVGRAAGAPELPSLVEVWREAGPPASADESPRRWQDAWTIDLNGEVRMDGVELLYEQMPETSHLTEIYGALKFNLEKTWSEEPVYLVPGIGAETAQTTVLIEYNWRDRPRLALAFDVNGSRVNLDHWIENWRKKKPRVRLDPTKPDRGLDFRLQVDAAADQIIYRGMEGRDLTGRLTVASPVKGQTILTWEDTRAKFKEGRARVKGRYERKDDRKTVSHDIEAENLEVADLTQAFLNKQGMISSGKISGSIHLEAASPAGEQLKDAPFQGGGRFEVRESRFVSNAIFRGVGQLLKLDSLFNDISFTRVEGNFKVVDDVVVLAKDDPVVFENPSALHPLSLTTSGRVGRGEDTDLLLSLQFFPIVGNIPLVGDIWKTLTGRIIRLTVRGSLDDPRVLPAPPVL